MLYNPLAWAYDGVSQVVSLGHWRDWQRTSLPELRGTQILELACGTGNMLLDLDAAHYRPVGLDLSPTMIRITRRKLRRSLRWRNVAIPLVQGRAQRLPFVDASFDSVLCTFPAEFIVAPDTLSEVARALRAGGRAVVVVMAQLTENTPWSRFLEWLYRVTGQQSPLPNASMRMQLAALGLGYQTMWKSAESSTVLLAVIEKRVDG